MPRLTFKLALERAQNLGVVLERCGRGYEYWNRKEGGGIIGYSDTLQEACEDFIDFCDHAGR